MSPYRWRLILVNSVLTAMLAHAMGAGLLPAAVVKAIDKSGCTFLRTGEETCNGGQCLVAWDKVCIPKKHGGLGVLSNNSQNSALLAKFLTEPHSNTIAPWACWFVMCMVGLLLEILGIHIVSTLRFGKIFASGLQTFRAISKVNVGDGGSKTFWSDLWLGDTPLQMFP
jgi:hypothetical protein